MKKAELKDAKAPRKKLEQALMMPMKRRRRSPRPRSRIPPPSRARSLWQSRRRKQKQRQQQQPNVQQQPKLRAKPSRPPRPTRMTMDRTAAQPGRAQTPCLPKRSPPKSGSTRRQHPQQTSRPQPSRSPARKATVRRSRRTQTRSERQPTSSTCGSTEVFTATISGFKFLLETKILFI